MQTLDRIAAFADAVTLVSTTCAGDRAWLVYGLRGPVRTVRIAEFLTVADGASPASGRCTNVVALRHATSRACSTSEVRVSGPAWAARGRAAALEELLPVRSPPRR
ncbi:hypothetical protein GCM10020358_23010 [Amorphoplanes nipponensis]